MEYRLTKSIPLIEDSDVLVAGGDPAGCAAAMAAARQGAKVPLQEQTFMLGGAATAGLVNAWAPFFDGVRVTYGGIAQEVFRRTKAQMYHIPKDALNWVSIDPEALKSVYDRMAAEAGVHVLFGSSLAGVEPEAQGTAGCLLVSNKAGLTAYKARVYIDTTGDGDLCAWADRLDGRWSALTDFGDETTYRSQSACVLPVGQKYLYIGDRWGGSGQAYFDSGYVFLPLSFREDGSLYLDWNDDFDGLEVL